MDRCIGGIINCMNGGNAEADAGTHATATAQVPVRSGSRPVYLTEAVAHAIVAKSSPGTACEPAPTPWERTAETKWGSYISDVERNAILLSHTLIPSPGHAIEIGCEGG